MQHIAGLGPHAALSSILRAKREVAFTQIHEVRAMLETHIACVAAERRTDAASAEIVQIGQALADVGDDTDAAARLDVEFHRAIARSTGIDLYVMLVDSIAEAVLANLRTSFSFPHSADAVVESHMHIATAIREHDPEAARDSMERHLAVAVADWREHTGAFDELPLADLLLAR